MLNKTVHRRPGGELAYWTRTSRHNLVFGGSVRIATMMQSCASTAKLRGGRPNLPKRHYVHGSPRVTATSDRQRQFVAITRTNAETIVSIAPRLQALYDAGRRTSPCDVSPVVTKRQSAISSLRASATIMVLRILPAVTRASNHCARAVFF